MSYFGRGWRPQSGPTPRQWGDADGWYEDEDERGGGSAPWQRGSQPPPRWQESAPAPYRGSYGTFMQRRGAPGWQGNGEWRSEPEARSGYGGRGGGYSQDARYGHGQRSQGVLGLPPPLGGGGSTPIPLSLSYPHLRLHLWRGTDRSTNLPE